MAHVLYQRWIAGELKQHTYYSDIGIEELGYSMFLKHYGIDDVAILLELNYYQLLNLRFDLLDSNGKRRVDVVLLQELRNAVENDFEVSDYFLTMNAVGNIIVNSTTGSVLGVGHNTGIVHQNVEQLADYMTASLGQTFLETQTQLKAAIDDLRTTAEFEQHSQLGKVISELGNCLQHGANTVAIVTALNAATPFLQRLIGG